MDWGRPVLDGSGDDHNMNGAPMQIEHIALWPHLLERWYWTQMEITSRLQYKKSLTLLMKCCIVKQWTGKHE